MGPIWNFHTVFTWVHCGQILMLPHLPGCYPYRSHVGKPKCSHIYPDRPQVGFPHGTNMEFALSIQMGTVCENPFALASTQLQPISFPSGQTQIHPHLPGWDPNGIYTWDKYGTCIQYSNGSCVGQPICTHLYPDATHIVPM